MDVPEWMGMGRSCPHDERLSLENHCLATTRFSRATVEIDFACGEPWYMISLLYGTECRPCGGKVGSLRCRCLCEASSGRSSPGSVRFPGAAITREVH
jgi:hypothetical protein